MQLSTRNILKTLSNEKDYSANDDVDRFIISGVHNENEYCIYHIYYSAYSYSFLLVVFHFSEEEN